MSIGTYVFRYPRGNEAARRAAQHAACLMFQAATDGRNVITIPVDPEPRQVYGIEFFDNSAESQAALKKLQGIA